MTTFVDSLLEALETPLIEEGAHEVLLQIGFLFEKSHGWGRKLTPAEQEARFGWTPEVSAATTITQQGFRRLRDVLIAFIEQQPEGNVRSSAIWALSKTFDPTTKPILLEVLAEQVDTASEFLFQTMIALDNLEEDIFLNAGGGSSVDLEKNLELARGYLQRKRTSEPLR